MEYTDQTFTSYNDGLVQKSYNSSVLEMELSFSGIKPLIIPFNVEP